jgi:hypothetical protein
MYTNRTPGSEQPYRRGFESHGGLHRHAGPQARERVRPSSCGSGPAATTAAGGDGAEELEPVRGGNGLPAAGDVEAPLLQQWDERGEDFEWREIHVFDHHPHPLRHRLRQRTGLPLCRRYKLTRLKKQTLKPGDHFTGSRGETRRFGLKLARFKQMEL